jgi:N-acetylmuramoyl-L-alanine amidase
MKNLLANLAKATAGNAVLTDAAKRISLAQAMLETGRGTSDLFAIHNNPYGMKYRIRIAALAEPVNYLASDGAGSYAEFASLSDAVAGYALFVKTGPYSTPENGSVEAYLASLVHGGYATDPQYYVKVMALLPEADNLLTALQSQDAVVGLPDNTVNMLEKTLHLGVIVGHNAKSGGAMAVAPLSEQEFKFNTVVAELMEELGPEYGIKVDILFRMAGKGYSAEIDEVYALADALNVDVTMELHFNAASSAARGTEVLSSGSQGSLAFANAVQSELVDSFKRKGSKNRGVKVLTSSDRGYRSVVAGRAPAILTEPFFGSNMSDASQVVELGKAALAEIYMNATRTYALSLLDKAT